jgi:hypothetical protein
MKIFVIEESFSPKTKVIEKLTELKHILVNIPMIVHFDGKDIDINAINQIRSRDPNNTYVVLLEKEVFKKELELILNSHAILLLNGTNSNLSIQSIMKISIASYFDKKIFFENKITKEIFQKIRCLIDPILLNGEFDKMETFLPTKRKKLHKEIIGGGGNEMQEK